MRKKNRFQNEKCSSFWFFSHFDYVIGNGQRSVANDLKKRVFGHGIVSNKHLVAYQQDYAHQINYNVRHLHT